MKKIKCEHDILSEQNMKKSGFPYCFKCEKCGINLHCDFCKTNYKIRGLGNWEKEKKCINN